LTHVSRQERYRDTLSAH